MSYASFWLFSIELIPRVAQETEKVLHCEFESESLIAPVFVDPVTPGPLDPICEK